MTRREKGKVPQVGLVGGVSKHGHQGKKKFAAMIGNVEGMTSENTKEIMRNHEVHQKAGGKRGSRWVRLWTGPI